MTPAQAIEVLLGALAPAMLLGGLGFLLYFGVLRVGYIHAVLGNGMAWSVRIIPVMVGGIVTLGVAPSVWPLAGLAEIAGAAILVGVPIAASVVTLIPAARLVDTPRADETVPLNTWCAALALPSVSIAFAMVVTFALMRP